MDFAAVALLLDCTDFIPFKGTESALSIVLDLLQNTILPKSIAIVFRSYETLAAFHSFAIATPRGMEAKQLLITI